MFSTVEARKIRTELKKAGISNKQVSVTSSNCSVNVTIKDLSIKMETVEQIANKHESISRCEASGEILQGGNMFVFVGLDSDALRKAASDYEEKAKEIFQERGGDHYGITISEKDDLRLVYWPNECIPSVNLTPNEGGYAEKKYTAHNVYHLAEALAYYNKQHGFTF